MNIDRLEALLWARIDGTIEPEESAELEALLAEQPEPREIERQITAIAEELDAMDRVPPPVELRSKIDDALADATQPAIQSPPRIRATSTWHVRWLPLAACLLVGVAVGYLLHPGAGGSIDRAEVTGAMLTPTEQLESAPIEILIEGGSVVASRAGSDVVVDLELTSDIELGLTLMGTGGPVRMTNLNSRTSSATEINTEQGWVALHTRGPGTVVLAVVAATPDDAMRIQVSAEGLLTEERWIGPSRIEAEQ